MQSVIIGISAFNHDSAAALVIDGNLVGFLEEERVTEQKNTGAFPARSISILLSEHGLSPKDITDIAFYFSPLRLFLGYLRNNNPLSWLRNSYLFSSGRSAYELAWSSNFVLKANRIPALLKAQNARLYYYSHHDCHVWYAIHASQCQSGIVISNDSIGEEVSSTAVEWATSNDGRVNRKRVFAQRSPHSIGYLYGAVSERLGFSRQDGAGKVMALASFCEKRDPSFFLDRTELKDGGQFRFKKGIVVDRSYKPSAERLDAQVAKRYPLSRERDSTHYDLAYGVQAVTETIVRHQVSLCSRKADNIILTGGVAQNSVANGLLTTEFLATNIVVPPIPHDAGCAIGAAIARSYQIHGRIPRFTDAAFLGTRFDDSQIRSFLKSRKIPFTEYPPENVEKKIIGMLLGGQTVGIFRGPMECGPRALGNRSIIALPSFPTITKHLNDNVKYREDFRPYGVIVQESDLPLYFDVPVSVERIPHMTHVFRLREEFVDALKSVVHVDGTCRVQTARSEDEFLLKILRSLGEEGQPRMVINTSMNVMGKPISRTIEQALACYYTSGLDALLFNERILVQK